MSLRTLALETSATAGSVALFDDSQLVLTCPLPPQSRSAQTLAPAIRQALTDAGWQPSQIGLVAVTTGPGSFTGLRVGVATAKVFAYSVGAEVLGVNTLDVIASQAPAECPTISAAIDAQRGQWVVRTYGRAAEAMEPLDSERLVDAADWLASLPAGTVLSGPVLERLPGPVPPGVSLAPVAAWTPRAETVGALALRAHAAGQRGDVWSLLPHYSRRAAAEEKWEAQQAARQATGQ